MFLFRFVRKVVIGMIKRISALLLTMVIIVSLCVVNVSAKTDDTVYFAGTNILMPKVSFEVFKLDNNNRRMTVDEDELKTVTLNGEALDNNTRSVSNASKKDKELVYILIDNSKVMNKYRKVFAGFKRELQRFIARYDENDTVIIQTFNKRISTKSNKNDTGINKRVKAIGDIKISKKEKKSCLYKVVKNATQDSTRLDNKRKYDRKYAIVFTDTVNNSKEIKNFQHIPKRKSRELPLYSVVTRNTWEWSDVCYKRGGGHAATIKKSNYKNVFRNSIKEKIENVTIVTYNSSKRTSINNGVLTITNSKGNSRSLKVFSTAAAKDVVNPTVNKIVYKSESNSILIYYSEDVTGADKSSAFVIKDSGGNTIDFQKPKYEANKDYYRTTIPLSSILFSGKYTIEFSDISDNTNDCNPLDKSEITTDIEATSFVLHVLKIIGFIMIPVLFLLALFLILLFLKKKKKVKRFKDLFVTQVEEIEHEKVHIEAPKGLKLKIFINTGNGAIKTLDYNISGSMIAGRADICDLIIDDPNMSRQHFVVEEVETGLAITDLDTTNGTNINGIPIKSRTFLSSGDKITAGSSVIIISY